MEKYNMNTNMTPSIPGRVVTTPPRSPELPVPRRRRDRVQQVDRRVNRSERSQVRELPGDQLSCNRGMEESRPSHSRDQSCNRNRSQSRHRMNVVRPSRARDRSNSQRDRSRSRRRLTRSRSREVHDNQLVYSSAEGVNESRSSRARLLDNNRQIYYGNEFWDKHRYNSTQVVGDSGHSRQVQSRGDFLDPRCSHPWGRTSSRRSRSRSAHQTSESGRGSTQHQDSYLPDRGEDDRNCELTNPMTELVKVLKTLSRTNSVDKLGPLLNTVPEFDPAKREQTVTMWLHKVNECATIYDWSEKQVIHYALPKLRGVAQRWYESLPSVLFSWNEWQVKLRSAFPSDENYGQMLTDMLAKRARFTDSLEDYFYEKLALCNRCDIKGKRAVDCILHGIDDRSVRLGAEAVQFDDPDKLLSYLRNTRNVRPNSERNRLNKAQPQKLGEQQARTNTRTTSKCYNCRQEGHLANQCTQPLRKCTKCGKIGHEADRCRSKVEDTADKKVMRVAHNTDADDKVIKLDSAPSKTVAFNKPGDKYMKTAMVNGSPIEAFLDFGSECCMIRLSECRRIGATFVTDQLPVLRGFGNSVVEALGKVKVVLVIDGVSADVELIVVPDLAMHVPMMVGQTFTELSHIVIHKTSDKLEIRECEQAVVKTPYKVKLFCVSDVVSSGLTVVNVVTDSDYEGEVFVEGGLRCLGDVRYSVPSGIYNVGRGGVGQIIVNCLSPASLNLKRGTLIARGRVAHEEITSRVLAVTADKSSFEPIIESDLHLDPELSREHRDRLLNLLNKYRTCFASNLSELGVSRVGEMTIELSDNDPVVYRPYRLAISEKEKVRDMIAELLNFDIIRPSTSPYASPIVLVKKKTGELRLCIDYRALNKKTVKENYPMPLIDDQLDQLAGNRFYTTLDLASGYYQIPIRESDRHKTGFVTPEGHYEFNRMPFGLANAPATFQRIINQVLGTVRYGDALVYLDDVIIPSKDIVQGLTKLETVLSTFASAGLTLKLAKCFFFGRTVDYLGFEVSAEGVRPGSRKVEAVEKFPVPENQHNVRQFLGLASFFRRFVPQFSILARPLTHLLKKDVTWQWGPEQDKAFRTLQRELAQKPTLALYDPRAETELHTDACKMGVAGILLQRNSDGVLRPVAYYSRQTTPEEQNYSSYDLETLAIVSSLQKFRVYLIGTTFKILTDCNSIRATFQKRDMVPRVARWWEQMQEFNFQIEYRPGKSMAHVDALSRNPISNSHSVMSVEDSSWLCTVQNADDEIRRIIGILQDPQLDDVVDIKTNYKLKNGKLFRCTAEGDRWVIPKGVRWQIVKQNHDDIGHFSVDKTLEKIKAMYWFPKLRKFVKKYVNSCLECAYSKTPGGKKPGYLHPIEKVNVPFDTIHTDHVGPFVRSRRGNMYILVLVDAFTKYIYLKPVRNTKSSTTIKVLIEYFGIFGVPRRLVSDRGSSFTSTSFKSFMTEKGIKHILNAVSTPRANGQVERYNKTIVDALTAKSVGSADNKWDEHLSDVQWGINNTLNKGINCTPSQALFGTRLAGPSENRVTTEILDDVVDSNSDREVSKIRDAVSAHTRSCQEAQKAAFDKKRSKPHQYKIGDLVRVERQVPASGQSKKLVPRYQGPYKVTKVYDQDRYQIEDTPLTKKGGKRYSAVVAIDKIKPWLNFARPHDSSCSDENESDSDK